MKQVYIVILLLLGIHFGFANEKESLLLPSATIAGTTTVCQNSASPIITFTGSGGTAPYTFTYTINGSTQPTITTISGNSITIPASTVTPGVFTYTLVSVHDSISPLNEQNINGQVATITVTTPPTVDFTFNNGNTCSGTLIQFTSSVSGTGPNIYSWDFGDGSPISNIQNPTHTFTSLGCGSAVFTVTLTVVKNSCTITRQHTITVIQKPDINFTDTNNPADPFSNCAGATTNPVFTVTLGNLSTSSCITSYSVNWDVANPTIVNNITFPISHTYNQLGVYTIAVTALGNNGCSNTVTYQVKNISSPGGGLSIPNNIQNQCAPTPNIDIAITNWGTNSSDTTYSISYGDSTTPIVLTQNQLVSSSYYVPSNPASSAAYLIPHSYTTTSCPTYYTVTLNITNACNANPPQTATIYVITKPIADFTSLTRACITNNVLFTNTTTPGYGNNCSSGLTLYTWDFGDPSSGTSNTINTGYTTTVPNANHTFSGPGVYTVTLTAQNIACGQSIKTQQICIESPLIPQFTLNPNSGCTPLTITPDNTTIITNSCSGNPTYQWNVTYASGYCGSAPATWNYNAGTTSTTAEPTFNFVTPGTYTISMTITNSCGSVTSATQTVNVKKPPTVTLSNITNLCQNAAFTPSATVSTCTNTTPTYLWSFPGGTPTSANTPTAPSITYATAGNYTVTLAVTNECGTTTATSNTFVVQAAPVVQNETLSVCSGVPFSVTPSNSTAGNVIPVGTTYSWNAPTVTGGITGGVSGTNQVSISGTLINPTNSVQTATYTITPKFGNCSGATFTIVVTVNPSPVVTFTPSAQTLCSGATSTIVTLNSIAGAALTWSAIQPSGIAGVATSGTNTIPAQTLTNSTNAPITVTYNASATTSGSSTCSGALYPYTITVKPSPSITEAFTPTVCSGVAFTVTPANSSQNIIPTGTTYSWAVPTVTGGITGGASGTNQTSITGTLFNPTDIPQTATYTVTPTTNGCPGSNFTVTVTVNPKPSIANLSPPAICSGTSFTVTPTNGGGNIIPIGTTYTWTVSVNNNVIGQSASSASGITTISQVLTNNTNINQTLTYTVTPISGSCSGNTFTILVTINPKPVIANITPSAICSGATFAVTPTNGSGNTVPAGTTYTWGIPVSNPAGAVTGGNDQSTAQTSISQTLVNNTNNPATLTYNVTPTSGICIGNPFTITVTVNPIPAALSLTNQLYCNGVTSSVISFTNTVVGTTYSWTNSNTSIGLAANGNGDIPVFIPTNTTNSAIVATISVIATANGCSRPLETFTITVNPAPTVLFSPAPQILCSGDTSALVTLNSTISGATFNWTATQPTGITGVAVSGTNTIPPQTLINSTNAPITVTYNATATTASGSTCAGAIYPYTIVVNPIPSISESFTPTVCSGTAFSVTPDPSLNAIPSGTTYSWNIPNVTGGMTGGAAGIGQTSISGTLNNPTDTNQTAIYIITPSSNGCPGTPFNVTVTISPKPIIANVIIANICSEDTFTITPGNGGGNIVPAGTTYNWTVSTNTNLTGQTASSTLGITSISQTLTNISSSSQTLTYIITPISGTCPGSDFTVTVTVNPKPTIANVTPPAICSGNTFTVTPVNGSGSIVPAGTLYTWGNPVSNPTGAITGGFPQAIGQSSISQTLINTTNDIATLTYTVTPVSGNCTGNPFTIIVTLSPLPVISPQTTTICSTNAFTIVPINGGSNIVPLGTTYTWTTPIVSPVGAINGAVAEASPQSNISQTLINTTTNPATVTYTVIPASGTCIGSNFTITVTVNPAINPNIVLTNNTCFGVNTASITTNITGGIPFSSGSPYQLSWTGPNGYTSSATSISSLQPGTYNVTITDAGGCPFSNSYTITEPTDIVITVDSENDITCYNANNGSINITVNGGTGAYSYNWTRNTAPYAVTEDISNLSPGTYVVTVTDVNNCGPKTASFTITEPPLLVVSLGSQTNVLCYGASTGAIAVNVIGGTPGTGYNFSWIGPNGFTSTNQNLVGIPAGNYDLTVTDLNGCIKNLSVAITQSTEITIAYTTTPINCYGANNASLSVTLSGGNPPYQFQWNNLSTSLSQTNLSAGNYTITVTDNFGCIKTATIVIPEAPIFTVNPIVTNVTCNGLNNGSINLNLTGGITPVALSWSDGSTAGLIRNNLAPGTYTATISDGTPCYIVRTFTIIEPLPLVLSANLTNAFDCTNASSGAINLVVAGGTLPYTYSWSNGATTEDLSNLTSGNYSVNVTDANGCTASSQYPIVRPAPIAINVATQTDFDCAAHTVNQSFVAQATGGIPPYQFQWSSGTISGANNEIMSTNTNGTVLLTVTDSNNCSATYTVTVATPILGYPSFDTTSYGFTTHGLYAIGDPIQFQSTITGDYVSVSWDFGDGTFSTELNPIHTYLIPKDYIVRQTVTYPFGCVYVQTISLLVEKGYVLVVPTAFTPNNDTLNDTYRPVTKALKNVVLDIYDTWGSLIYSEKGDVLVGWDGKVKGFNAENGNYYSKVKGETFYGTIVNSDQTFVLIK